MQQLKIRPLDLKNPKHRAELERIFRRLDKKFKPIVDAIRDSQRITAEDLATRVNV